MAAADDPLAAVAQGANWLRTLDVARHRLRGLPPVSGAVLDPMALLRALDTHGVRFVVIGGVAMQLFYARDRLTRDLDICYADDDPNVRALCRALRALEAQPAAWVVPNRLRRTDVVAFETNVGALDVLRHPPGTTGYDDLATDAIVVELAPGLTLRVASREAMLRMKRAANRPGKDWADIAILEGTAGGE